MGLVFGMYWTDSSNSAHERRSTNRSINTLKSSPSRAKKLPLAALNMKHYGVAIPYTHAIQSTYKLLQPLKYKRVFEFIQNK